MSRPPSVSPTAPISSRPGASRARAAAPRCSRIRTCAAPISAHSRVCRARGPRYHDPRAAAGARAPRRRPLRSRRGRPLTRLRRPQGSQRRPRRADHARRLRRLLALGTPGFRSAARASARRRRRARVRRAALLGPLRPRRAGARGDAYQELAADRFRTGAGDARTGRAPVDGGRALDHDHLRRRRPLPRPHRDSPCPPGEPRPRLRADRRAPPPAPALALGAGDPRDRGGLGGRGAHRHRRPARLPPCLRNRHRSRRRRGDARERRLLDQPVHRARVDAEGAHRSRPRRARLDARHLRRWSRPRPRGGGERVRVRRAVPRGRRPRHLPGRARRTAPGALRAMSRRGWLALGVAALAALAVPLVVRRDDVLNFLFLVLLSVALAQSWNVVAGYAGQINLGHAAFFGLGALVTRTLWIAEWPVLAGAGLGALAATTLALGEILRITVGNVLPEVSTLPTATIGAYRLADRYYFALALAAAAVGVVAALERSRAGLGMQAVREDEEAAEASGVGTLRLKLLALVLSTALAGLAGGLFAYYHISYYPAHPFGPHWTFDALLITVIGPVLGAVFYVFLKEYLAIRWVDFHLLIFGALFITVVLLLPGGLVEAAARLRTLARRAC